MKKILSGILVIGILFGGLSLGSYTQYAQADEINTLSEIRSEIAREVRDVYYSRWSSATIDARINDAQLDIVYRAACLQGTTYYTTHISTREYTLPTDSLSVARVSYYIKGSTNCYKRLLPYTLAGLDKENSDWQILVSSQPLKYYLWANKIGLQPPASSEYAGTNYLRIDYIIKPTPLSSDNDVPFNGVIYLYPYHKLITLYVVSLCLQDDNNPTYKDIKNEYDRLTSVTSGEPAKQ